MKNFVKSEFRLPGAGAAFSTAAISDMKAANSSSIFLELSKNRKKFSDYEEVEDIFELWAKKGKFTAPNWKDDASWRALQYCYSADHQGSAKNFFMKYEFYKKNH